MVTDLSLVELYLSLFQIRDCVKNETEKGNCLAKRQEKTMAHLQLARLEVTDTADVRPLIHNAFMWLVNPCYPTVNQLQWAMALIDPGAQQIVIRAYGLDGGRPLPLAAIAHEAGCQVHSIQATHSETLAKLAELMSPIVAPRSLVDV